MIIILQITFLFGPGEKSEKNTYRVRISLAVHTFLLRNISDVVIHVKMIGFDYFQIDSKDTS